MASRMPARYIDRNGVLDGEIAEKIELSEVKEVKKENQKLKEEVAFIKERIASIEQSLIQKATEQNAPIFLNTAMGQEGYSVSGLYVRQF